MFKSWSLDDLELLWQSQFGLRLLKYMKFLNYRYLTTTHIYWLEIIIFTKIINIQGQGHVLTLVQRHWVKVSNIFWSEATGPINLKFHMELPWHDGIKVCLILQVTWPKLLPGPYMLLTLKNFSTIWRPMILKLRL